MTESLWRSTSGEVMVCRVNAGNPAAMTRLTTPGGEKASSALPKAAACAGRTPCSSASACTPSVTRLGGGCNVRTSEPRRTPSRTSLRVALTIRRAPAGPASRSACRSRLRTWSTRRRSCAAVNRSDSCAPRCAREGARRPVPRPDGARSTWAGLPASAISVNVCTPPSTNAIKIAVTLLVTAKHDRTRGRVSR